MTENECKIPVPSLGPVAERLRALGARRQGGGPEENAVYDTPDGRLAARGALLRLRTWPGREGGLLTVKELAAGGDAETSRRGGNLPPGTHDGGQRLPVPERTGGRLPPLQGQISAGRRPPAAGPFKTRAEYETRVDSPEALDLALRALGYLPSAHYRKEREEWEYGETRVALDFLAGLGSFVEVEGENGAIHSVLAALGLDPAAHVPENYLTLLSRSGPSVAVPGRNASAPAFFQLSTVNHQPTMPTLLENIREGRPDPRLAVVAAAEGWPEDRLARAVAAGRAVVPWAAGNALAKPLAVGDGLRCKVNANIGTSPDRVDVDGELAKLRAAVEAGADAVMDLSTGGDLRAIRRRIREACPVSLGSVPLYEAGRMALARGKALADLTEADMMEALRLHVADGVDFVTVHCGVTRQSAAYLAESPRLGGVTSRGGSLMLRWMAAHGRENPLFARFEEVVDLCRERDVTLSLGDALRPGALADAGDRAQVDELYALGALARRAAARGAQVMIEGPGHVPYDQIPAQMRLQKAACGGAPFYVLGPLVTDVAPGWDHVTAAIGGTLAATHGANFLCYVTPAEHLRLPTAEDVHAGVVAMRIAAHAADVANGLPGARDWDDRMSAARRARDWRAMLGLALDPATACRRHAECPPDAADGRCTMCGELCALIND